MRDGFRSEVILCVCLCASPTVNVQTFMPYSHQHRRPVSNRCQWTAAHRLMTLGFTLVLVLSLLLSWVCAGLRRSACRLFLWALGPSYQYFSGHGTVGVECIQALCLFECTKSIYILWDSRIHRHPSILPLPSLDSNSTERLSAYLNHTLTRPHHQNVQGHYNVKPEVPSITLYFQRSPSVVTWQCFLASSAYSAREAVGPV